VLLVTSFKSRVLGIIFLFYRSLNLTEDVENLFFCMCLNLAKGMKLIKNQYPEETDKKRHKQKYIKKWGDGLFKIMV